MRLPEVLRQANWPLIKEGVKRLYKWAERAGVIAQVVELVNDGVETANEWIRKKREEWAQKEKERSEIEDLRSSIERGRKEPISGEDYDRYDRYSRTC
jgi:hypothetical protein